MAPAPPYNVLCPALIGRAPALAALEAHLGPADGARVLLLSGEAGIGKSRLAAEARRLAGERHYGILQGHAFEPDRTLPYAPFLDLLRNFCLNAPAGEAPRFFGPNLQSQIQNAGPLLNLLPELAACLPQVPPAAPAEPEQEQQRLFQALLYFVLMHSQAPLLILIEDLHWSDDTSLALLLHLIHRLSARPILFLLTLRAEEAAAHPALRACLAELERTRAATELRLAHLGPTEVEAMIRAIFNQPQPVRAEFVSAVHALTDGNPFFVEEVLKALVAEGDIYQGLRGWTRKPLADLSIPRTVQEAVLRRTAQLPEAARQLLTLAAIAGRRFDFALLQALTQHSEERLVSLVKDLIATQLVTEESPDVFTFRHALTRQAVVAGLLARERRALHYRVAQALERLPAAQAEHRAADLAYQFFEAEVWGKALAHARRAAEQARRLYAPRTAIEHLTRAIGAARNLNAPLPLPGLLTARGEAYETLGDFESAHADYETARDAAASMAEPRAEWQALLNLSALWAARDYARMGELLELALQAARRLHDEAALAQTLNRLGNWHMNVEHYDEAVQRHAEALAIFEARRERQGLAQTYDLLAMTNAMGANVFQAMSYCEEAALIFREVDDRGGLGSVLSVLGTRGNIYLTNTAIWPTAPLEDRVRDMRRALAMMREVESRPGEALATAWLAQVWATAGDYGQALNLVGRAVAMAEEIGHRQFTAILHWVAGAIHLDLLAQAEAVAHLNRSLALAEQSQARHWTRSAAAWLARACLLEPDMARADAILQSTLAAATPMRFNGQRHAWAARAEWLMAAGRPAQALDVLERLINTAPHIDEHGEHAIPYLSLLLGQALAALGRTDQAEAALRGSLQVAQRLGAPGMEWRLWAALSRLPGPRAAEAAEVGRQVTEALAASIPDEALRVNFLRRAEALFAPAPRLTPRQALKERLGGLTPRERDVAAQLAAGKTNRAIAEALVVSERTVEKHVENIMSKLGFDTRAQIAAWAVAKGLGK